MHISKIRIPRTALDNLTKFVEELNGFILDKYGEREPILSKGNLDFCLWNALKEAKKQKKEDFHKVWASCTLHNIAKTHPFVEGNKRTSYVVSKIILNLGGYDLRLNYEEAVSYLRKIAIGKEPLHKVHKWISKHSHENSIEIGEETKRFIELLKKVIEV